ncbi:hypothetical protein [Micromonospora sp. CA-248212]|uniref:hypothetical protein n=1 Tax=Micromonospora sp. CA-248212 TaxID=3239961 RepID=UPI003D9097A7
MNDQTTGTPKRHPTTADPRPLKDFVDGEDIDAAGRAALDEIERRFEQTWDIKAGLQEIFLTEHYRRAVTSQQSKFDASAGLAAIVGPARPWVQWVEQLFDPADGGADLIATDNDTREVYLVEVKHHLPTPPDTLQQIDSLARRILAVLHHALLADRDQLAINLEYDEAMSSALESAKRLRNLPSAIEDRLVTREQAVHVVESVAEACQFLWQVVRVTTVFRRTLPRDLSHYENDLLDLSNEAYRLRVPVQRLFDPSDDLVDTLL